jgi:hypothetical protein
MSIRQIVAACLSFAAATTVAHAQSADFTCPTAGTVEQRAVSTYTYNGASPSDPTICMVTNRVGKPELRLFNLFPLTELNSNAQTLATVRANMLDVLSGRKTSATFQRLAPRGSILQETWTFLRKEPYSLDGKTYNTVVLDEDMKGDPRERNDFHGHYTHWVDPKSGFWLKTELNVISGSTNYFPQASQIHSLSIP